MQAEIPRAAQPRAEGVVVSVLWRRGQPTERQDMIGDNRTDHDIAWMTVLSEAVRRLGYKDPEAAKVAWIAERVVAVAQLRRICEDHGDNDWPDSLHLGDVIDKHLGRHLG